MTSLANVWEFPDKPDAARTGKLAANAGKLCKSCGKFGLTHWHCCGICSARANRANPRKTAHVSPPFVGNVCAEVANSADSDFTAGSGVIRCE
jgi:hypothetical protein